MLIHFVHVIYMLQAQNVSDIYYMYIFWLYIIDGFLCFACLLFYVLFPCTSYLNEAV